MHLKEPYDAIPGVIMYYRIATHLAWHVLGLAILQLDM